MEVGATVGTPARVILRAEVMVPLFGGAVCAGFPSPADDFIEEAIDPARLLISNPPATFLFRVAGESMRDAGIYDRDILVVDRSLAPRHDDVVVVVDGERSLKRLQVEAGRARLVFENADWPAYPIAELADVEIWGVATWNLHRLRGAA